MSDQELKLYDVLVKRDLIIQHATPHMSTIKEGGNKLLSVRERKRLKLVATSHTPDDLGTDDTVFSAYKTRERSVPFFVLTDPLYEMNLSELMRQQKWQAKNIWCSEAFYPYKVKIIMPPIRIGQTVYIPKYIPSGDKVHANSLKQHYYFAPDGTQHVEEYKIGSEVYSGTDIVRLRAMRTIEQLRHLDKEFRTRVLDNPQDKNLIAQLEHALTRVRGFEIHKNASLDVSDATILPELKGNTAALEALAKTIIEGKPIDSKALAGLDLNFRIASQKLIEYKEGDVAKFRCATPTVLCTAAAFGDVKSLEALLSAGADINFRAPNNESPLLCAVANGSLANVEFLLAYGKNSKDLVAELADPFPAGPELTALQLAAIRKDHKIFRLLIENHAALDADSLEKTLNAIFVDGGSYPSPGWDMVRNVAHPLFTGAALKHFCLNKQKNEAWVKNGISVGVFHQITEYIRYAINQGQLHELLQPMIGAPGDLLDSLLKNIPCFGIALLSEYSKILNVELANKIVAKLMTPEFLKEVAEAGKDGEKIIEHPALRARFIQQFQQNDPKLMALFLSKISATHWFEILKDSLKSGNIYIVVSVLTAISHDKNPKLQGIKQIFDELIRFDKKQVDHFSWLNVLWSIDPEPYQKEYLDLIHSTLDQLDQKNLETQLAERINNKDYRSLAILIIYLCQHNKIISPHILKQLVTTFIGAKDHLGQTILLKNIGLTYRAQLTEFAIPLLNEAYSNKAMPFAGWLVLNYCTNLNNWQQLLDQNNPNIAKFALDLHTAQKPLISNDDYLKLLEHAIDKRQTEIFKILIAKKDCLENNQGKLNLLIKKIIATEYAEALKVIAPEQISLVLPDLTRQNLNYLLNLKIQINDYQTCETIIGHINKEQLDFKPQFPDGPITLLRKSYSQKSPIFTDWIIRKYFTNSDLWHKLIEDNTNHDLFKFLLSRMTAQEPIISNEAYIELIEKCVNQVNATEILKLLLEDINKRNLSPENSSKLFAVIQNIFSSPNDKLHDLVPSHLLNSILPNLKENHLKNLFLGKLKNKHYHACYHIINRIINHKIALSPKLIFQICMRLFNDKECKIRHQILADIWNAYSDQLSGAEHILLEQSIKDQNEPLSIAIAQKYCIQRGALKKLSRMEDLTLFTFVLSHVGTSVLEDDYLNLLLENVNNLKLMKELLKYCDKINFSQVGKESLDNAIKYIFQFNRRLDVLPHIPQSLLTRENFSSFADGPEKYHNVLYIKQCLILAARGHQFPFNENIPLFDAISRLPVKEFNSCIQLLSSTGSVAASQRLTAICMRHQLIQQMVQMIEKRKSSFKTGLFFKSPLNKSKAFDGLIAALKSALLSSVSLDKIIGQWEDKPSAPGQMRNHDIITERRGKFSCFSTSEPTGSEKLVDQLLLMRNR